MLYGFLFFIGYLSGMAVGVYLASHWNKEIIDNLKADKEALICMINEMSGENIELADNIIKLEADIEEYRWEREHVVKPKR